MRKPTNPPDEAKRKALFADLVALQDRGVGVPGSRADVGRRFEVSPDVVLAVEDEGIEKQWPPLGEGVPE